MSDIATSLRECADFEWIDGTFAAATMREAATEIERLRAKEEWADEASELLYNFATGKDDGSAIIAHVKAKLETI